MLEVKIKSWKEITLEEKLNLDYMVKLKELYQLHRANYEQNDDYIRIADEVTKLRIDLEKEIAKAEAKKQRLEKEQSKILKQKEKEEKNALRLNASLLTIEEIIEDYNIWQTGSGNLSWYLQELHEDQYGNRKWTCLKKETLQARFPALNVFIRGSGGEPDYKSFNEFCQKIVEKNRVFTEITQSWTRETGNGLLNIMNKDFASADPDGLTDYHWIIDAVFESISGGTTAETKDHLEQIIFGKYLHPENIFLPSVFLNDAGSSGKGLFVAKFLTNLFAGMVADNCNIEHLTGKFNGVIAGKAIVFINETAREKVDVEKIKSFLGSPTFKVEDKFEKAYDCDNTALVISATNQSSGGITLSGENSDRRYSIFSTKTDIYQVVAKYFKERENKVLDRQQAQDWIEETGQYILSDKKEIGKWLCAMLAKYGDVKHVRANMGEAYKSLVNRQRGAWQEIVEQVFTEPGFVYIRDQLLKELVAHFNKGEVVPGKKRFREEIERLCRDKNIPVILAERTSIGNSVTKKYIQRTTWKINNNSNTVQEDEKAYGELNDRGQWVWNWIA